MEEQNIYVSSDGTKKDVRNLDYQYLVNALAKSYRELNETNDINLFFKYSRNIDVLEMELLRRRQRNLEILNALEVK